MRLLKYVGGGAFVPGVPAADHECQDDKLAAQLVANGSYEYAELTPEEKKARDLEAKAAKALANAQAAAQAQAEQEAAERKATEAKAALEERVNRTRSRIVAAEKTLAEVKSDGES